MKKTLYTLNIGKYAPEITALTYPLLMRYADKIGAKFQIISERKFPDWPMDYEKLQIYELGRENDWNLYIDSDTLVHPDFFDLTNHIPKDTVLHNGADMASVRWTYDKYFWRDGRNIGSCNWFALASDWCIDLWHPLEDLTLEQAVANIHPRHAELVSAGSCRKPEHLISDYTLSRNIARFGLKFKTTVDLLKVLDPESSFLWHVYTLGRPEKLRQMKAVLEAWGLQPPVKVVLGPALLIDGWMTPVELKWLALRASEAKHIVEIGSHLGRSTRALADNTSGMILAVDDWKGCRDAPPPANGNLFHAFQRNMKDRANVKPLRIDHAEFTAMKLEFVPDLIFIDGDHSYESVRRDCEWAARTIAPSGLICGHDFDRPEVRRAIWDALPNYQILSGIDRLWWADSRT